MSSRPHEMDVKTVLAFMQHRGEREIGGAAISTEEIGGIDRGRFDFWQPHRFVLLLPGLDHDDPLLGKMTRFGQLLDGPCVPEELDGRSMAWRAVGRICPELVFGLTAEMDDR